MSRRLFTGAITALALSWAGVALASPRPLPFTYSHEQLGRGELEVEQYVDFTPIRVRDETSSSPLWYGLTQFQTEFEFGLTQRLELGLYVTLVPTAATGFAEIPRGSEGTGLKQRLRYQLADTGEWPIDVALYGEVTENERELELEAKVILQRRFGIARLVANLTGEDEYYYSGAHDLVINPSAGVTFELSPSVQPGIEWWMRSEYPQKDAPAVRPFELGPHHYLGPALLLQFGKLWWTNGVYYRVSDTSHTQQIGESYGKFWVRTVIGIEF
jgi:hypothetical protein